MNVWHLLYTLAMCCWGHPGPFGLSMGLFCATWGCNKKILWKISLLVVGWFMVTLFDFWVDVVNICISAFNGMWTVGFWMCWKRLALQLWAAGDNMWLLRALSRCQRFGPKWSESPPFLLGWGKDFILARCLKQRMLQGNINIITVPSLGISLQESLEILSLCLNKF